MTVRLPALPIFLSPIPPVGVHMSAVITHALDTPKAVETFGAPLLLPTLQVHPDLHHPLLRPPGRLILPLGLQTLLTGTFPRTGIPLRIGPPRPSIIQDGIFRHLRPDAMPVGCGGTSGGIVTGNILNFDLEALGFMTSLLLRRIPTLSLPYRRHRLQILHRRIPHLWMT